MSGILLLNTFLEITLVFILLPILLLSSLYVLWFILMEWRDLLLCCSRRMQVVVEHSFRESMVVVLVLLD
jgi:hypothetical protein